MQMASWAVVELVDMVQPGAVPVGQLQGTRCVPPPADPGPPEEYVLYALRQPHDPMEHLKRSPPDVTTLRVVTANCGGLGAQPRILPRVIAYLARAELDAAHLQEATMHFAAACLAGLPYRVCVGPPFPKGGLVTLVHLHPLNRSQLRKHAQEHDLCVPVEPASSAGLAAVNMHLSPALPVAERRAFVGDASAFLRTVRARVKSTAGDLIKAQGPRGGGWFSHSLGPKGLLAEFRAPYRPANRANVVWQVGRHPKRELGWVRVGPKTPCAEAAKVVLLGVRSRRMMQYDLGFAQRVFAAVDP